MKFSEYDSSSALRITAYDDTYIVVNGQPYAHSLVVTRNKLDHPWIPQKASDINLQVIETLLSYEPEIIILGTGRKIRFPEPEIMARCAQAGIGLEVMDTASACRTYNVLLSEEREVIAALLMPGT